MEIKQEVNISPNNNVSCVKPGMLFQLAEETRDAKAGTFLIKGTHVDNHAVELAFDPNTGTLHSFDIINGGDVTVLEYPWSYIVPDYHAPTKKEKEENRKQLELDQGYWTLINKNCELEELVRSLYKCVNASERDEKVLKEVEKWGLNKSPIKLKFDHSIIHDKDKNPFWSKYESE